MLDKKLHKHIDLLIRRYPILNENKESIEAAYLIMEEGYLNGRKLLLAGNGGSAADCGHIVGELMKSFKLPRPIHDDFSERLKSVDASRGAQLAHDLQCTLTAIPLISHEALITAYMNDVNPYNVFAQQVFGYGRSGDVFLAISTSGNSLNIINAAIVAKASGIKVIAMTGLKGGELADLADICINVPEEETFMIQELHLPVYHCWCLMLEDKFFGI